LLEIKDFSAGMEAKLVRSLLETIARLTGFDGRIVWDTNKPNGRPARWRATGLVTVRKLRY